MTNDESIDKAISLLLLLRESEIIDAMKARRVPYDEVTATAIMAVGIGMMRHFEKGLDKAETFFLGLASEAGKQRRLQEAEETKEKE